LRGCDEIPVHKKVLIQRARACPTKHLQLESTTKVDS
jgi:hypothetical protein